VADKILAPADGGLPAFEARRAPWLVDRGQRWWRDVLRRRMLAVADAGSVFAFAGALAAFGEPAVGFWSAVLMPGWLLLAKLHGLYDRDHRKLRHLTVDDVPAIMIWSVTGIALTFLLLSLTPAGAPAAGPVLRAWIVLCVSAVALRWSGRIAWRWMTPRERVLLVGTGPTARATRHKLELFSDLHAEIVDERPAVDVTELHEQPSSPRPIDRIVVAEESMPADEIEELVGLCHAQQLKLSVVPPLHGLFGLAQLNRVAELPVLEYDTADVSRTSLLLKRAFDAVLAALALVVLAPLFVLVAVAIVAESGGPIVFRQRRAGFQGRPFWMLKFRTMVADTEEQLAELIHFDELREPMFKLRHDPRVTRVGRILRRYRIDELPQLVNVLRGEMSLVGPRPEQVELVERYEPEHALRLVVKPGMTGPMQVFGRGELSFEERVAVERDYIDNLSLARDLRIIALTIPAVVTGRRAF
jgi:exopolysaccharide biosynthesis polyprenyl glycosylphosphotransferase